MSGHTAHPNRVTKSLLVHCPQELAFRVWTTEVDLWWPKSHTLSGDVGAEMRLEEHVGGRLYERTPAGEEKTWGKVLHWDPPHFISFSWYPGTGPQNPTMVDVRFHQEGSRLTRVELEHRGPELIGELWESRAARFVAGWDAVFDAYAKFL